MRFHPGEVRQQLVDWQARERKLRRGFHPVTGEAGGLKVTGERRAWYERPVLHARRVFREPWREWYALTWFHTTYARYPSTSFFLSPKIHDVLNSMYLIGKFLSLILDVYYSALQADELLPQAGSKKMWRINVRLKNSKYPTISDTHTPAFSRLYRPEF